MSRFETQYQDTVARVRAYRDRAGLTASGMARAAGLSPNALRHMDRPDWAPSHRTLAALERLVPEDFVPDATA